MLAPDDVWGREKTGTPLRQAHYMYHGPSHSICRLFHGHHDQEIHCSCATMRMLESDMIGRSLLQSSTEVILAAVS